MRNDPRGNRVRLAIVRTMRGRDQDESLRYLEERAGLTGRDCP